MLADLNDYELKVADPDEVVEFLYSSIVPAGTGWSSLWGSTPRFGGNAPAVTTVPSGAAAICDRTTPGAMGQRNATAGEIYAWVNNFAANLNCVVMLVDRLAHIGGLSGTSTLVQAVNTPALTRYTDGRGVFAAYEVYTTIGSTPTTITMNYTNQDGVSKTSPAMPIGASGDRVMRVVPFPLAAGDSGVRSVASVQLAASTSTAGNFGVTLYRPLFAFPASLTNDYLSSGDPLREIGAHFAHVMPNAALTLMLYGAGQVTSVFHGNVNLIYA